MNGVASCGRWQYSHRLLARFRTKSRVVASMLCRKALEKAPSFRLDDRDHIDRFNNVLVGCLLIRRKRPLVCLLAKYVDLSLEFVIRAKFNQTTCKLRCESVGNWFQKAIQIADSTHARSIPHLVRLRLSSF